MDSKYIFTTTWFQNTTQGTWDTYIPQINPTNYLEIGSYEGASTSFIIDTIAPLHKINIFAIDTWEGGVEHNKEEMPEVEKRFDHNMKVAARGYETNVNITKLKGYSDKEMIKLAATDQYYNYFDLIYIDGSHMASDILSDAILAFKLLKVGGFLIFDDYLWAMQEEKSGDIILPSFGKLAIDSFINIYFGKVAIAAPVKEQVVLQKIKE